MPCTRRDLEQREARTLAPYAQFSAEGRGRVYEEPPPEWRTQYQRDRDRVIHSRAFRRLEYKTQVFLNDVGDHLRTRLTHTMEVSAIARNISRALRLNEDLTETIALAHDLGHSPFGHNGEAALNRLMRGQEGFEHNLQSLRIVELLEQKYPGFAGLNLTWEVREGLAKHGTFTPGSEKKQPRAARRSPSLEAQVANLADEITYYSHDLDDGLTAGLFTERSLVRDVRIWAEAARAVQRAYGRLPDECRRYFIIRCIIDGQVRDVVLTTEEHILASSVSTADQVRAQERPLVRYSPARRKMNLELRKYLYANLYNHPAVREPNQRAVQMLEELFRYYRSHPKVLRGLGRRGRPARESSDRRICDYLAGMTDRYAMQEYRRIFQQAGGRG